MKVVLADISADKLQALGRELVRESQGKIGESNVLVVPTDVSKLDQVVKLRDRVYEAWGEVSLKFISFIFSRRGGGGLLPLPPSLSTSPTFTFSRFHLHVYQERLLLIQLRHVPCGVLIVRSILTSCIQRLLC
jgi:hypothetical protein